MRVASSRDGRGKRPKANAPWRIACQNQIKSILVYYEISSRQKSFMRIRILLLNHGIDGI